jgi:hypothetical protein
MIYECKENDCIIEMGKDESEVLIYAKGDTVKTVIGLKDLKGAFKKFELINTPKDQLKEELKEQDPSFSND